MKKALITGVTGQEGSYLAAQTHVTVSFEEPEYKANSDALGPLHVLEAIRILGFEKKMRSDQASASELYGLVQETPQARSWAWTSYHREKPSRKRVFSITSRSSRSTRAISGQRRSRPCSAMLRKREELGWSSRISFEEVIAEMVCEDLRSAERDEMVKRHGYPAYSYYE